VDSQLSVMIEAIHISPTMAVAIVSGGGARSLAWLLGVPGASSTIMEARVPYSARAMRDVLGREPDRIVSPATAEDMALAAYRRAVGMRADGAPVVGISATAAIASDRPKKGGHRCFVASWTDTAVTTYGLTLVKGLRDRSAEDKLVSRLVVRALAEACGVGAELALDLDESERVEVATRSHGDPVEELLSGAVDSVTVRPDGAMLADEPFTGGVLAGSFDPFHQAHRALARAAGEIIGADVVFELSVLNVDKPPLARAEIDRRLAQFTGIGTVVLTRAPTFREKAELFQGCTFVVGWDTAVRLVEPRYYGGDEADMATALAAIRHHGCRFLVAGRVEGGVFHTLEEVRMPAGLEDLVSAIPEAAFRNDLSSTELRLAVPGP
jgi:nicotinamide mononucleotide (NMN) deamidase PncC